MILNSRILIAVTIILFLSLIGCSSTPKPTIAKLSFNIQPTINPYLGEKNLSEPRPVVIRIYELKSAATFNTADFLSLFNQFNETLKSDLLDSEEIYLSPGKKFKFDRKLNSNTQFLGVVAAFRDIELAQWRAITEMPVDELHPEIFLLVENNKILIGAKEKCGFFCQLWSPKAPPGSLYEIIE